MKNNTIIKQLSCFVFAFIMAISFVAGSFNTVLAQGAQEAEETENSQCDEAFYATNDILFYNPCATSCQAGPSGGASAVSTLRGKNNGEKIFNFWVDSGLTAQQAAGITGSMFHEGGYSPFRQEESNVGYRAYWPRGGWGIAQFTHDPGQRGSAKAFVSNAVGADLFNQYYKVDYGGAVTEANNFIPNGVPPEVNDKFLLAQLQYLLDHIQKLVPSTIPDRVNGIREDFGQNVPSGMKLYDYLKTLVQAKDSAVAWTYLYEYPGDRVTTSNKRITTAADILEMYSNGTSTTCGGNLKAGGMNLEEAKAFMEKYKTSPDSVNFIGGAGRGCPGGPLSNCVSFSVFFINKHTNLKGFKDGEGAPGNGSTVVANAIARNPGVENGHAPRPYAIFSTPSGSMMCGDVKCGHTGVILGVDAEKGDVIVGEAGCGTPLSWDTARKYPLSRFNSDAYTYIYTDTLLKGTVQ